MTVNPLKYGVAALRGVVWTEAGVGPEQTDLPLGTNVALLGVAAVVLLGLAAFLFSTAD